MPVALVLSSFVAASRIGVKLTELRPEQAAYIGVDATGPYKPEHYRY